MPVDQPISSQTIQAAFPSAHAAFQDRKGKIDGAIVRELSQQFPVTGYHCVVNLSDVLDSNSLA